jgi:hypothetical protein
MATIRATTDGASLGPLAAHGVLRLELTGVGFVENWLRQYDDPSPAG